MTQDDPATEQDAPGDAESAVRRGRFSGGPARSFLSGLAADRRIFAADLAVDRAHVVMLAEQEIITDDTASAILAALADVEAAGFDALPEAEDVHEAVETAVIETIGPDGGRMHTARSRNDEVATCLRYRLREDLLTALDSTLDLRRSLLELAKTHRDTVAPGYTHRQPAQPTTVGHWALSYESALRRDTDRLVETYDRCNLSPLGAGAFAGTPFDIDRDRTAELLGFDGLVTNATDAVSTRDFFLDAVGALATQSMTLSGLAEDLIFFTNRDFVELADDYASTSSIMPQKKNPDTLELVRARSGDAVGSLAGLLTALKGLPRAYNRDLQRVTTMAWDAVDSIPPAVDVTAGAVATATWHPHRLAAAAEEGFATATGLADALAMAGVPFRSAHEAVALAAERAEDSVPTVATIQTAIEEVLDSTGNSPLTAERIEALLDPANSVASRDSAGGPAPASLERALETAERHHEIDAESVRDRRRALASAEERLDAEVTRHT